MVSYFKNNPIVAYFIQDGDKRHLRLSRQFQQLVEQGPDQAPLAMSCESSVAIPELGTDLSACPLHCPQTREPCVSRTDLTTKDPPELRKEDLLPADPQLRDTSPYWF